MTICRNPLVAAALLIALTGCNRDDRSTATHEESATNAQRVPKDAPPSSSGAPDAPLVVKASGRASRFTQVDAKACALTETIAETGDWVRRCPGVDGLVLEWSSGDLREDLAVIGGGRKTALHFPTLVANGAFDSIGKTVEWRGLAGGKADMLVVRVRVAGQDGKDDAGRLVVARLDHAPCIVAIVPPGAGQSDKARVVADGKLPACLKS